MGARDTVHFVCARVRNHVGDELFRPTQVTSTVRSGHCVWTRYCWRLGLGRPVHGHEKGFEISVKVAFISHWDTLH